MTYDLDANIVKEKAKALGADLVGIVSADTLNEFPPDPKWPQTPDRISPHVKSVIVISKRYQSALAQYPGQYMDMLVLRAMDRVGYRLTEWLEDQGFPSFVTAAQ